VGAIAGEAGIDAGRIGRIELKDSFSLVEVEQGVADRVIKGLNGTSIRGRAARVDYHREERGGGGRGGGRPPRREGGSGPRGRPRNR
jgi:ATP-dependent RNA helicase DeaD